MNYFNINLNLYRSFYYVAKFESFTKASEYVNISQSALSINVHKLESDLNVELFVRNSGQVKLTSAGKELYQKLNEVIKVLESEIDNNEINIGCLRFIADNYLDEAIIKFKEKNPSVNLKLEFNDDTELFQKLKKGELDILICRYPLFYKFDKNIIVEKLIEVQNVMVCSKDFYTKNLQDINLSNYTYPLILPSKSEKRRILDDYLITNNIKHHIVLELPNSLLLKKLILNGQGIGYINQEFVKEEVENKELILLNFSNLPKDNITIIYNSQNVNKELLKFIKILKEVLKK